MGFLISWSIWTGSHCRFKPMLGCSFICLEKVSKAGYCHLKWVVQASVADMWLITGCSWLWPSAYVWNEEVHWLSPHMKLLFWHILPLEKYISRRAKAHNTYKNKSKWGERKKKIELGNIGDMWIIYTSLMIKLGMGQKLTANNKSNNNNPHPPCIHSCTHLHIHKYYRGLLNTCIFPV